MLCLPQPLLLAVTQEDQHDRFRSRLRVGMRQPVEQRVANPPSPPSESLDAMYWSIPPPSPPPPRRASPPPPQLDACAEDYDAFSCDEHVPCITQCAGCPNADCWLRCYDKCDKARHQEWVGDHCAQQCVEQHASCQADCGAEAARIAAAAPRNNASAANATTAAADRHCSIGDESERTYPFDCTTPCLEQCDPCASSSQCLPRCFHQCTQGSNCHKASRLLPRPPRLPPHSACTSPPALAQVCEKIYTGCDFTCRRLQSGQVDNLLSLFQV